MGKILIDFSQRDKDKLTVLDARVRNLEFLSSNFNIVKKENIQINRPGSPSKVFCTAQLGLNGLQCSQKFVDFQIGLDFYYSIHKPILRGIANRLCFIEG